MTTSTIVIDESAICVLDTALIEESWFESFGLPGSNNDLKRVEINSTVYILSKSADENSGFLAINVGKGGVFSEDTPKRIVFERVLRIAMRHFDRQIGIPPNWGKFQKGQYLSIFSDQKFENKERIIFDQNPDNNDGNIYAYSTIPTQVELDEYPVRLDSYNNAKSNYIEALIFEEAEYEAPDVGNIGILLSTPLGTQLATPGTLDEWYKSKLNTEQVRFVDKDHSGPARLRGAAGTGKTQAMAVKCLKDFYDDLGSDGDKSFAFITHSTELAEQILKGMFRSMDNSGEWERAKDSQGQPKLWTGTLYELATQKLKYDQKGLEPIDLDGHTGRQWQELFIQEALEKTISSAPIALGPLKKAPALAGRLNNENDKAHLISEFMNEFACALDAENIKKGTKKGERYLTNRREPWQMSLENREAREVVLEIHDAYRQKLKDEKRLSLDQMIADFAQYLLTHEWEQLKDVEGFDVVFVDEYHYLTRIEAMTLQHLFKPRAKRDGKLPLFMAYDLKQSQNDACLGGGIGRFKNPGVGVSSPVDLTKVYRSTPQITSFLCDIDAAYPALDLEGEHNTYSAVSTKPDGDNPNLLIYENDIALIDDILSRAQEIARIVEGGGRNVAVLCMNEELFHTYSQAGRNQKKMISVLSRDDLKSLRYAKNKCILSMPDFVGGLQFSTVFLINVDKNDLVGEFLSPGLRRRYLNRAYLGASRASERLFVASSKARGGPNEILETPLKTGSLNR